MASPPDLILMDLAMPRLDGWGAFEKIRSNPATNHIPVVALTAHALMGDAERALGAGFAGHLSKPIDEDELLRLVRRLLARPTSAARASAARVEGTKSHRPESVVDLDELVQVFLPSLGPALAGKLVERHAAQIGLVGSKCTSDQALRILDAIGASEAAGSAVAHFAKVRWRLRRPA